VVAVRITPTPSTPTAHTSTSDLMSDAAAQVSRLVHDEIALAKLEMQTKAKQMGVAGGLLGAALVLARIGFVLAWVLLVVALANVWPLWLAVAVPMAGAFVVAGVLALLGRRGLKAGTPPVPTEASQSVRTDLRSAQEAIQEGRRS
jgi:membrane protein implicated in regulation of membrane protease activity